MAEASKAHKRLQEIGEVPGLGKVYVDHSQGWNYTVYVNDGGLVDLPPSKLQELLDQHPDETQEVREYLGL